MRIIQENGEGYEEKNTIVFTSIYTNIWYK